jgi:pimeloyl-ACP methyl ester carboxylesterase
MVGALIEARGLGPITLVGNCMGSAIALRFAMQRPDAVRALVLVNPLTEATFGGGSFGAWLRLRRRAPRLSLLASRPLERLRLPRWAAARALSLQIGRSSDGLTAQDHDALCACYANREQMSSLLGVVDDMASYAALDRFEPGPGFPPICTIWGLENRVLSPAAGRLLNQTLRPSRQVWLEGCGHLPMLERPDAVTSAARTFLMETSA